MSIHNVCVAVPIGHGRGRERGVAAEDVAVDLDGARVVSTVSQQTAQTRLSLRRTQIISSSPLMILPPFPHPRAALHPPPRAPHPALHPRGEHPRSIGERQLALFPSKRAPHYVSSLPVISFSTTEIYTFGLCCCCRCCSRSPSPPWKSPSIPAGSRMQMRARFLLPPPVFPPLIYANSGRRFVSLPEKATSSSLPWEERSIRGKKEWKVIHLRKLHRFLLLENHPLSQCRECVSRDLRLREVPPRLRPERRRREVHLAEE